MFFLVFFTHVFSCLLSWCLVTWLFFTFPHVFLVFLSHVFFILLCFFACKATLLGWAMQQDYWCIIYEVMQFFCFVFWKKKFFHIVTFVFHVLLCSLTSTIATRLLYCVDRKKWKGFLILAISKQLIMLFLLFVY